MKTEVLLRSIGKINDELIADAESEANTKRKPGWAKLGTMAACLALVLCTGIATHAIRSNATAGTFTMDVNPSVEYTIAKSGAVKSIRSLNSDAENALSDVALGKQSVETALTRTVAAYEACGYMENGEATVLISFDSRLDANAELKASLSAEIQQALEQTDAVGTLVFHSELTENAEVAKIAEEFHVSLGRADWILTAANKTGLPTDEVARMSLDELLKFQEVSGISSICVSKFISLEEAKKIALRDAKLDELTQKIVFTREELNRNQGKPCYLLEFYTGTNQYFYQIDAKSGSIIYAGKFITLSEAKKIALDDAGCKDKVSFTEETLVSGGIKTPYYRLVFADAKTQWTYRIDAVLGNVFNEPLMRLLGATETAMPYALDYARYIFLAAPFMMGSLSMNNLLRFQGLATYGMVGIISGGLLNMLLDPLCVLLDGHALFAVLQRIMHQQPLACRRASAVNHDDFLIRVLRRKFLRRVRCGGISAGQSAGERNAKDILTLVQQLLEAFLPRRGIDSGCLNHHAAAELTISLLFRHFRRSRNGGNAIDRAGKRHDVEIMLCLHPRLRHVSGRIRNNIVHFCPPDVLWGSSAACRQRPPSLVSESGCADLETMQLCGRAKKETEALTSASCADTSNRKDAPRVTMHCMLFTRC